MTPLGLPPEQGRWIFIALGLAINLALGSIYAWSAFLEPVASHFRALGEPVSASGALLPFSLFLVAFAVAMPISGGYIDRWGPRSMALLGGFLTGMGWLLASFATSPLLLALSFGVIGGTGVGITYGVPVTLAARWFPDRRGTALGLTLLGFGISALLTGSIAGFLLGMYGVIPTFRIFGVAFIVLIPLLALPLSLPPAGWRPAGWDPAPGMAGLPVPWECTRGEMVRTPAFYGLWVCFFIACAAGLMAVSIAVPVGMEAAGLESGVASIMVAFFAIFNGGGRPVFGALTDRLNPRNTAMLSFGLITLGSLLLWRVPTPATYILAFALLWGSQGAWPAIAPTSTAAFFGTRDYPRCYGVVYLAYGAGALAGPMLAGSIRTATGSYIGVFPWVAVLAASGIGISYWLMRPPEHPAGRQTGTGWGITSGLGRSGMYRRLRFASLWIFGFLVKLR
ncbi:MAG: OFA family MFS transporter [Methanomicrobiales archaeon]|nr:OFA family MFS transporter [Methanomicrobiales archaeon]